MIAQISSSGRTTVAAMALILMTATAPALAQSAASRIDQPTPGTLPSGVSTVPGGDTPAADRKTGGVAPPNAIQSTTDVMESPGSVQGADGANRTNPLQHLPKEMR